MKPHNYAMPYLAPLQKKKQGLQKNQEFWFFTISRDKNTTVSIVLVEAQCPRSTLPHTAHLFQDTMFQLP